MVIYFFFHFLKWKLLHCVCYSRVQDLSKVLEAGGFQEIVGALLISLAQPYFECLLSISLNLLAGTFKGVE